ncbi:MAG: hypothetical protein HQL32_09030 [Planctomycetes bacterium]|nr:hypothetical protein [Planctomycetota bacterium]
MNRSKKTLIPFHSLGEYRLHTHKIKGEELGPKQIFNCSIRNADELRSERIELYEGEELHFQSLENKETALLRFDENGLWAWQNIQKIWWPLRSQRISLDLDKKGGARVRYLDQ